MVSRAQVVNLIVKPSAKNEISGPTKDEDIIAVVRTKLLGEILVIFELGQDLEFDFEF